MPRAEYVYAKQPFEAERARLDALEAINDPTTIEVLERVGVAAGWRCLEVGGGGGSIASWLCDRVGESGSVVATDLDPRFLEALEIPNLDVRQHDIIQDPIEEGAFDLVHSRFLLEHLTEDAAALRAMLSALKPGGILVAEDVDLTELHTGANVIGPAEAAEALAALAPAMTALSEQRGIRRDYGRHLPTRFQALGLTDLGGLSTRKLIVGGTKQAELPRRTLMALKEAALAGGFGSAEAFDRAIEWNSDPRFLSFSPIVASVWGRKP